MRFRLVAAVALAFAALGCGAIAPTSDICGPGTHLDAGVCLPDPYDAATVSCGPGTVLDGQQCVLPDAGGYTSAIDAGSECAIADNIFIIDGDGGVHSGRRVIQGGVGWKITTEARANETAAVIKIDFGSYYVRFDTHQLQKPLAAGVYPNFVRAWTTKPGEAGFDVGGEGRGCSNLNGDFAIVSVTFDANGDVTDILGNYKGYCDIYPDPNFGCIHVKPKL